MEGGKSVSNGSWRRGMRRKGGRSEGSMAEKERGERELARIVTDDCNEGKCVKKHDLHDKEHTLR